MNEKEMMKHTYILPAEHERGKTTANAFLVQVARCRGVLTPAPSHYESSAICFSGRSPEEPDAAGFHYQKLITV